MTMSGTHTEAVLNKLTKPELVQLILKTEEPMSSQITDLSKEIKDNLTYLKNLVLIYEKEVVFATKSAQIVVKIDGITTLYKAGTPTSKSDMSRKEKSELEKGIN